MFQAWGTSSWDEQFQALDVLRSLCLFHSDLVQDIL